MPDRYQPDVDCVLETGALGDFNLSFSSESLSNGMRAEHDAPLRVRRSPVPVAEFVSNDLNLPLVLDTGADLSWVNPNIALALLGQPGASAATFQTPQGPTVRAVRVPTLTCGDAVFRDVLFRVPSKQRDLEIQGVRMSGVIGTDLMRLYDWSIGRGYRSVRRSRDSWGRQEWIGLGVDFRVDAQDPGRVVGLANDGPAHRAGVVLGDRILTLDGIAADPVGDVAMQQVDTCECIEPVLVRYLRSRDSSEHSIAISTAPMV